MKLATSKPLRLVAVGAAAIAVVAVLRYLTRDQYDLSVVAQRAESYLRERGPGVDPAMVFILDYLDRRFGLEWVRPTVARTRQQARDCAAQSEDPSGVCASHTMGTFIRLIDPTARITPEQVAAAPNTLDALTATALYCKTNGLTPTFLQGVERLVSKDDYDPPHAVLALQWAIEQGCLDPRAADVAALRSRVLEKLVELARNVPQDQAIESVALLTYAGAAERVQSDWLQTIAAAQKPEGGWGEHGKAPPNDHTSTLALWAVLEATREGKAVTWVPQ